MWEIVLLSVFLSAISAGLTSFGDAILMHACSAILSLLGLGRRGSEELQQLVVYITVMSACKVPFLLWFSRSHLRAAFGYGIAT